MEQEKGIRGLLLPALFVEEKVLWSWAVRRLRPVLPVRG